MPIFPNPSIQNIPTAGQPRGTQEIVTTNFLSYWQNQLMAWFAYRDVVGGGQGIVSEELANSAVHSRNFAPQSGSWKKNVGRFNFVTNGQYNNALDRETPTESIAINYSLPNQIARIRYETGSIWNQSALNYPFAFYLERSTTPDFSANTVKISNSSSTVENIYRTSSAPESSHFLYWEDDTAKVAGVYYYRIMVKYGENGHTCSHWVWQSYLFWEVFNARSTN